MRDLERNRTWVGSACYRWLRRAVATLRRPDSADLDDELESHVALHVDDLMRAGLSRDDATRLARARLGSPDAVRAAQHDVRRVPAVDRVIRVTRQELRLLGRGRSGLVAPALVLALTTSGALALTRVIDAALLRPLPYPDADRLVAVVPFVRESGQRFGRVPQELFDATHADEFFDRVATVSTRKVVRLDDDQGGEVLTSALMSRHASETFGVTPIAGRLLAPEDFDAPDTVTVPTVLTERYWESAFARDPDVVGRVIEAEDLRLHVVGVAARMAPIPSFFGSLEPELLMPDFESERADYYLCPLARLRPGVDPSEVQVALATRLDAVRDAHPRLSAIGVEVSTLRQHIYAGDRPFYGLLGVATAAVLLTGAVTMAVLLIAAARRRAYEHGLRLSLGDTPSGLRLRLWIQTALLSAMALPAVWVSASAAVAWLESRVPADLTDLTLNITPGRWLAAIVLETAGIAVAAATIVTLAAYRSRQLECRGQLMPTLKRGGRRSQASLVAVQLALATSLVVVTTATLRSAIGLAIVDTGVEADHLYIVTPRLSAARYRAGTADVRRAWQDIRSGVSAQPGVISAALTFDVPMSARPPWASLASLRDIDATDFTQTGAIQPVSREYFDTMGITLLEGRPPTAEEDRRGAMVGVVSQSTARQVWGDTPALGRQLSTPWLPAPYEVIGVVRDTRHSPTVAQIPTLYAPMWNENSIPMNLVVRSRVPLRDLARVVRDAIHKVEPRSIVPEPLAFADHLERWRARPEFFARVFSGIAVLALVLGSVGVAAMAQADIVARRREIGIRLALGEPTRRVTVRVMRQGAVAAIGGAVPGALATAQVRIPVDPGPIPWWLPEGTLLAVPIGAVLIAIGASFVLCLRAVRDDCCRWIRDE